MDLVGSCVQFQSARASSVTLFCKRFSVSNTGCQTAPHTPVSVRTANAYPLPVLCLKIDLFLNDRSAPQSSRLEDRRVYGTSCSPGLARSPLASTLAHTHTRGCAHALRASHSGCRWQLVHARDKRPPCTPSVKQGTGLIGMQAALLFQSGGGSFAVERAERQLAGAAVWRPYVHYTLTSFHRHVVLGEDNIRRRINMQQFSACNRPWCRRVGELERENQVQFHILHS